MAVVSNSNTHRLSVIIPAYNEEVRLPEYLHRILAYLERVYQKGECEIIVVDDGSSDTTAAVASSVDNGSGLIRVIRLERNRGKGYAVRTGMLEARGTLRIFADADGATPFEEIEKLLRVVDGGGDIAVASRALKDESRTVLSSPLRRFLGNTFNIMVRTLAVPGIYDTQCGFKLFRGDVAEVLFTEQSIPRFGFDVEVLFLARKYGFRISEVPVNWNNMSGSKVNVVRDSVRMFRDLLVTRLKWVAGRYRHAVARKTPAEGAG